MIRANGQPYKIVVASDIHLMNPVLMRQDGEAFQRVLESDRKLLIEGEAILNQFLDEVLDLRPDLLLLTGDLTKDGELLSHQLLAQKLLPLHDKGIAICVIPGNHDINNPHARYYEGGQYTQAKYVTPEQFSQIYSDFGYSPSKMVSRGPGLSYASEAIEGLLVIALDSCIYDINLEENYPTTFGEITEETLQWLEGVMEESKKTGKEVVVMTHHNVLEHFPFQSFIAREYVVKNWVQVGARLAKAGVKVIFTGHFHAQNVIGKRFENGLLYDIETGSIVTYPCPYRIINLYKERMEVSTNLLSLPKNLTGGLTLQEYAYDHLKNGIPGLAKYLSNYIRIKHPNIYSEERAEAVLEMVPHFIPLIMDIYTGHLKGDQTGLRYNPNQEEAMQNPMSGDLFHQLKQLVMLSAPKYTSIFGVVEGILHSHTLGDNELIIPLI